MMTKDPTQAWEECPRADFCNINKCILHLDFERLENSLDDWAMKNKQKCIPKSIRVRIAEKWKLASGGLTSREREAGKRWAEMPESEKQARISKLQEASPISRLSAKGYAISRRKQDDPSLHIETEQKTLQLAHNSSNPQISQNFSSQTSSQTNLVPGSTQLKLLEVEND